MKVTETISRECCQLKDLKPVAGCKVLGHNPELMFCVHCGWRHRYFGFMDLAGSRDWEYRKVNEAPE